MRLPQPILRMTPKHLDLDVGVIYTYERDLMQRLLDTLGPASQGIVMRLLLVDNASADAAEPWRNARGLMKIVTNAARLHYAANLNRILEASTAPYVLVLNTDMHFNAGEPCLAKMVDFMQRHPDCGIAGCRIYHDDQSYAYPARRFQTLPVILSRRFGMENLFRGAVDRYLYRERSIHQAWDCDWLSGCFLMLRRAAFEEVGHFDPGFLKYFEDVDICMRMRQAGWRVMFNGDTYCYHSEARASKRLFSRDAWRHARSYFRWLHKWGFAPALAPDEPAPQRRAA